MTANIALARQSLYKASIDKRKYMTVKLIAAWVIGGLFLLAGVWIVSNLEFTVGVSEASYALALIIALGFVLAAGLLWIAVAVATRNHE